MSEMTLIQQLRGRAAFLRDKGRIKSPGLMEEAANALDAHLAQPAQAVDVGAIREVIDRLRINPSITAQECADSLAVALTGEKAGPVDGEVLVAIERGEGYEDVHPELVAEDCLGNATERGWRWRVVSASPAPDKEGM